MPDARGCASLRGARNRLLGAVLARALRPRPRRPPLGRPSRGHLRLPLAARVGRARRQRLRRAGRGARSACRARGRRAPLDRRPPGLAAGAGAGRRAGAARNLRRADLPLGRRAAAWASDPGLLADLVVLDRDPLAVEPEELRELQVVATMVGGRWVHNRRRGTSQATVRYLARSASRQAKGYEAQSTATASAEQTSRMRSSLRRPRRLLRAPTGTFSTESRFTADRRGTGSSPASSTTLGSPRTVVVHGATSARRRRGIAASRERTTTGLAEISGSSHHQISPRNGSPFTTSPPLGGTRPGHPIRHARREDARRKPHRSRRSRSRAGWPGARPAPRRAAPRRSVPRGPAAHRRAAARRSC